MKPFILWFLYIALFFYCICDAYQTKLLLDLGIYEMNPWLRWLVDFTGTWVSMLIVKVVMLLSLFVLLIKYNKTQLTNKYLD